MESLTHARGGSPIGKRPFVSWSLKASIQNSECARRSGFSVVTSAGYAKKLLDGVEYPHVVARIQELREERERRYGVTTIGQLERLAKLSRGAEDAGQFSSAINAEKIRSALGGLTIDRRENINVMDQMSRDEITSRLAALQQQYPQAFRLRAPRCGTSPQVTPAPSFWTTSRAGQ